MLKKTKMTKKILVAAVLTGLLTGGFMGTGYADPPTIDLEGVDPTTGKIILGEQNGDTKLSKMTAAELVAAGLTPGVIIDEIKAAIDITGNPPISVTADTNPDTNKFTYKISVATDGKIEENNTGIVTGGTVYNALEK